MDEHTDGPAPPFQHHYYEEDERWAPSQQWRDWLILFAMCAVFVAVHVLIFVFEPGLR